MNQNDIERYHALLLELFKQTAANIESFKELAQPITPDNAIGRLSRMEAISEQSVHQANLKKSKTKLNLIKNALIRIERQKYGICLKCEEDIDQKRLNIIPESPFCMSCLSSPANEIN